RLEGPRAAVRGVRNVGRRLVKKDVIKAAPKAEAAFDAKVPGTAALKTATVQGFPVVRGHEQALVQEPGKTLKTTLRIAPGVLATPIGMAADVGLSAGRLASTAAGALHIPGAHSYSSDEIIAPLKGQAHSQVAFAKEVAKVVTSNDPNYIKHQVENHL